MGALRDSDLVDACRRGSLGAYEELYRRHGARLLRVALGILGDEAEAEDAVQEAFLRAHRGLKRFQGRSKVSTWLHRICVNACLDLRRKRSRMPMLGKQDDSYDSLPEQRPRSRPALRMELERCLKRLPQRPRTVFVLFEVEGNSHREIGEIMGFSEQSSRVYLFEAKKRLREMLKASRAAQGRQA